MHWPGMTARLVPLVAMPTFPRPIARVSSLRRSVSIWLRRRGDRMRRREFITIIGGAMITRPSATIAQTGERMPAIGLLWATDAENPGTRHVRAALMQGLSV